MHLVKVGNLLINLEAVQTIVIEREGIIRLDFDVSNPDGATLDLKSGLSVAALRRYLLRIGVDLMDPAANPEHEER